MTAISNTERRRFPLASLPGQRVGQPFSAETFTALRSASGTARVINSTVGTATNAGEYIVEGRLSGGDWITVQHVASGTSATDLRDGVIAAWNGNSLLAGIATASAGAGTSVDWTAIAPALEFEVRIVANPGSALGAPTITTAGGLAFLARLGRYYPLTDYVRQADVQRRVIGAWAALAGPTVTFEVTHAETQTGEASIPTNGPNGVEVFEVEDVATGADAEAFAEALASAFNALDNASAEAFEDSGWFVTVSLPVGYQIAGAPESSASGGADITFDAKTAGDKLPKVAIVYDAGDLAGSIEGYEGDRPVPMLVSRDVISTEDPGESIDFDDHVWIETSGPDAGRPFATSAPSRFAHPTHKWLTSDDFGSHPLIEA